MIIIKKANEIETMKQGGKILVKILKEINDKVAPGIETISLNNLAEKLVYKNKARPSFKNFTPAKKHKKYPASLCTSINKEVVHGIPSKRRLEEGDILSLDLGIFYKGFCTDAAITVPVGKINNSAEELINTTKKALDLGIDQIKPEARIGDISVVIQKTIEKPGFSVIRDCVGHGVGKYVHEEPSIPNFGKAGEGPVLKEGMTLAVEPMATLGDYSVEIADDGWTVRTRDGGLSCHFEWTVAVTKNGYEVLTPI